MWSPTIRSRPRASKSCDPCLQERLELLQRKFELMKDGRFDEAAEIVRNGRGKALMDQIDSLINEMISREEILYSIRDERMTQASNSLETAISAMIALLVSVAAFAVYMAHRQIHALRKSGNSLRLAYNELIEESTKRSAVETATSSVAEARSARPAHRRHRA